MSGGKKVNNLLKTPKPQSQIQKLLKKLFKNFLPKRANTFFGALKTLRKWKGETDDFDQSYRPRRLRVTYQHNQGQFTSISTA